MVGGWYFSSTRLAAKKLIFLSHLAVIGVLTCPLFGLCDCDMTIRTVVGDGEGSAVLAVYLLEMKWRGGGGVVYYKIALASCGVV